MGNFTVDVIAAQLKNMLDGETTTLLGRVVIRAVKSGNANAYLKQELRRILNDAPTPVPARAVSAKVVK